jgi:hypothetical protein
VDRVVIIITITIITVGENIARPEDKAVFRLGLTPEIMTIAAKRGKS